MIKVSIIGSGNVAQHLITAFAKSNATEIIQVFARKPESLAHLISADKITSDLNSLAKADVYIISVSDSAIETVSKQLPFSGRLVVHTSGSVPLETLDTRNRRGVFYPLQTFSKNRETKFESVPICLESEDESDYKLLEETAAAISSSIHKIDSTQRKAMHVAAVFVNNFTNHLYHIAEDICIQNQVPFAILKPLIRETSEKVMQLSPADAQTGPAVRNDKNTIDAHLEFLTDPNQNTIYRQLTQSIQHVKKL